MTEPLDQPLDELDPRRVMAGLDLAFYAGTWHCPTCPGHAEVIAAPGRIPYAVEHFHDSGCPEHEDNLPAAVRREETPPQ